MPHPNELPPQETAPPLPQSPSTWCTLRNGPYKAVDLPNTKNVGLLMQTHQFKLRHRRAKSKFTQIACELALEQIKKDAPVLKHDTGRWEEDAVRLNCWTGRFMQLIQSKTKVLLDQISASSLSPSRGAHGDGARHELPCYSRDTAGALISSRCLDASRGCSSSVNTLPRRH